MTSEQRAELIRVMPMVARMPRKVPLAMSRPAWTGTATDAAVTDDA